MSNNLYWPVYQNLERELIELANHIHIDDKQLYVYSIKVAELLIRTCVEFESLAKELYLKNGGNKPDNKDLYFDTDCLAFLKEEWCLDLKKVQIVSNNFYFNKDENKILTPLRKAHKRGNSSEQWLRAYQAIKHNRKDSLEKATIKNLISALAGLFILNIYYRNEDFSVRDIRASKFDRSLGSKIFSLHVAEIYFQKLELLPCIYKINFISEEEKEAFEDDLDALVHENWEDWKETCEKIIEHKEDFGFDPFIEDSKKREFEKKAKLRRKELYSNYEFKVSLIREN